MKQTMRYGAFTLDGGLLFQRDTAQELGDAVASWLATNQRPHLAYTYDNRPGMPYPYMTWAREIVGTVGTPHATYDEAADAVMRIAGTL